MNKCKIALAQTDCLIGNKRANMEKASETLQQASRLKADIVLFPEMFLSGYFVGEKIQDLAEPLNGDYITKFCRIARENYTAVVFGFPELEKEASKIYNSMVFISKVGKILGCYRKTHLWPAERELFEIGWDLPVISTGFGNIGMLICYDIYFPEQARILALKNVKMILTSSADWKPFEKYVRILLSARALENNLNIIYVNRVGLEGDYEYFGESCIIDPEGETICRLSDKEELLVQEIDLDKTQPPELDTFCLENRRPEIYTELSEE